MGRQLTTGRLPAATVSIPSASRPDRTANAPASRLAVAERGKVDNLFDQPSHRAGIRSPGAVGIEEAHLDDPKRAIGIPGGRLPGDQVAADGQGGGTVAGKTPRGGLDEDHFGAQCRGCTEPVNLARD